MPLKAIITRYKIQWTLIFLFFVNSLGGIYFLNEGLFHYDSVILAQAVENTYKTGRLQPAVRGRYGAVILNFIVGWPFLASGKTADFATRFSSTLFHALSIAVMFLFVRELLGDYNISLFSSLLFSFTPFYFVPATYGKEHAASICFLLLSFFLLCRGFNRKSPFLTLAAGIVFVFSLTIREAILMMLPLLLLLYLRPVIATRPLRIKFREEALSRKYLLSFAIPFCISLAFVFFAYLTREIRLAFLTTNAGASYFRGLFAPEFRNVLNDLLLGNPLLIFIFFVIGVIRVSRQKDAFVFWFLLLWTALIFCLGNISSYAPRYLDIVLIPVYIFVAFVLRDVYRKDKAAACGIILYLVCIMVIFMYPILKFRKGYNGEKRFAVYVKEKTEDKAVILGTDDLPFIDYYGKRRCLAPPLSDPAAMDKFIKRVAAYIAGGTPVYLIESALAYDPGNIFRKALDKNFRISVFGTKLTEDYHRPELQLRRYDERLFKVTLKDAL